MEGFHLQLWTRLSAMKLAAAAANNRFLRSRLRSQFALCLSILLLDALSVRAAELVPVEALGVRITPGFKITLFADHDLAPDVHAMTLDADGRPVITSAGYIQTLHDTDGDGRADKAVLFAETKTGGMGLCLDGRALLFHGDGALWRFNDANGDGVADGPPERIGAFKGGEHGAHAMRKGPDGWWYFIGGNNTEFRPEHATLGNSPVKAPEAGALMRFSRDLKQSEIIAHGFRNPYDFDFDVIGEIFTYDSDVEREFFLPWYTPTRLYHVAHGMHHGWRLPGHLRSWDRFGHYLDSVDWLWPVGRGSPTGVTVYRHTQFPEQYRGGLFYLDWTFGRVWFTPLTRRGAGFEARPEVFIEPLGTHGFAPTDICVAPDGSLFLSIGGRKTRGAVYRVQATAWQPARDNAPLQSAELAAVLRAPQPLDAWSRARWEPIARELGPQPFADAAGNDALAEADRVRAIEVLVDTFGGLPAAAERAGLSSKSALVRARTVWAMGRAEKPVIGFQALSLMHDADPLVRRCALETLADRIGETRPSLIGAFLPENLNHADRRVRQAAARLLARMPDKEWQEFWNDRAQFGANAALATALAAIWRSPDASPHLGAAETALAVLQQTRHDDTRAAAIRLITRALGDWNLHKPSLEIFTGYEFPLPLAGHAELTTRIRSAVRGVFPSKEEGALDAAFNAEAARLLAMLEDDDPQLPAKVASLITAQSSATDDFHCLTVLARLRGPLSGDLPAKAASALLNLDTKLAGAQQRSKQTWGERLVELARALIARNPQVGVALANHPRLISPAHVGLVELLGSELRDKVAGAFLAAAEKDRNFVWSGELIRLVSRLPEKDVSPALRRQWSNRGLRDDLLPVFARNPDRRDRGLFFEALESANLKTVETALNALGTLPPDDSPENLLPVLRLLQRLQGDPKQADLRRTALALISRNTGQPFVFTEPGTDAASLREASAPVFEWFAATHPGHAKRLQPPAGDDAAAWAQVLQSVPWDKGDAARGETIFRERACQTCHAAAHSLGPDLAGVASRLSKEDLFYAIVFPNRDVAPPYQPTTFVTRDGQTHTGMVVFTSADGVILQTGPTATVRLDARDIASQQPGGQSLMPAGLLNGTKPEDLADLFAYLKGIGPRLP